MKLTSLFHVHGFTSDYICSICGKRIEFGKIYRYEYDKKCCEACYIKVHKSNNKASLSMQRCQSESDNKEAGIESSIKPLAYDNEKQRILNQSIMNSWKELNMRISKEDENAVAGLSQIYSGAFDDLQKNGDRMTVKGKSVSRVAATLDLDNCFLLVCQTGRSLLDEHTANVSCVFSEICTIKEADYFPNCIAIVLGALLEKIRSSLNGQKMKVYCIYETIKRNGDPLRQTFQMLEPCFPWAQFIFKSTETNKPVYPTPPLPSMEMELLRIEEERIYREQQKQKEEMKRKAEQEKIRGERRKSDEKAQRAIEEARIRKERELEEERQRKEHEMKTRSEKAVHDFNSDKTRNDAYVVESGGSDFLVSGHIITYDNQLDQWYSARDGQVQLYETSSYSEYSGYHDEDNNYYSTCKIEMPAGWDETNWFTHAFGITEEAFDHDSSDGFPIDAFYYEGFGKVKVHRWQRRIWMEDDLQGLFIIYLRRCCEGFRLLRICTRNKQIPFEFHFAEKEISSLFHEYGDQCALFEDFLLTPSEQQCFTADSGNKVFNSNKLKLDPYYTCFIRRTNQLHTEISNPWWDGMILSVLSIRCKNIEDYLGETP